MAYKPEELQPKEMSDKEWLKVVADALDKTERESRGSQGEGSEVILMSHEIALVIAERLRSIAERIYESDEITS